MDIDLAALPDDVEALQRMVHSLVAERTSLSEAKAEIERLNLIIKKLQRNQFGRRAEQLDGDQLQFALEDLNADLARTEAKLPLARTRTPQVQDERPSLPAHLPREDRRLDVEHKACPCSGGALHLIGETVSDAQPRAGTASVIRVCRPRYGCRACGTMHQAPRQSGRSPRADAGRHVLGATDRRCVQMPAKIARSTARHGSECHELRQPPAPPSCLATMREKRKNSRHFGSDLGNPISSKSSRSGRHHIRRPAPGKRAYLVARVARSGAKPTVRNA